MFFFIKLLLLLLISIDIKSYQLLLLLLDTDIKTYFRCYFIYPLGVIKVRPEQDTKLPIGTILLTNNILEWLQFCLNNTYFLFQNQYFEQTKGAAMGHL